MTMGSRIVVMKDGFVQQIDTPKNLYKYPVNMFVASFIGTPQMSFFDGVIEKNNDEIIYHFNCGTKVALKASYADTNVVKYAENNKRVSFGIRTDNIKLCDKSDSNEEWGKIDTVVSMIESLGGETLIYANLNIKDIDNKDSLIVIKTGADCEFKRGDIVKACLNKRQIYVFDKETELNIKI